MGNLLQIRDLHVSVGNKEILKGINLEVRDGEIHAIMGPNGNGKSTLLQSIMGHPDYEVTKGEILFNGEDVLAMEVDERSRAGIFLGMQYPAEIPGVTNSDFLRAAVNAREQEATNLFRFARELENNIQQLKMKKDLAHRFVNDGFSGGEKKRNEILQLMMLKPKLAMLDEIDSGLDVDAIKVVSDALNDLRQKLDIGLLCVSHYERFFMMLKPSHAHVIYDGRIVCEGDYELVEKVDQEGYDWLLKELGIHELKKEDKPLVYSLGVCAHSKRT